MTCKLEGAELAAGRKKVSAEARTQEHAYPIEE